MVQPHDALRIDQHVAAQLIVVAMRLSHFSALRKQLQIDPPGPQSIQIPELAAAHSVSVIELALFVDQHRKRKAGFLRV